MMIRPILSALILCSSTVVFAQAPLRDRGPLTSGNSFIRECQLSDPTVYAYCMGYSSGVWDIVTLDRRWGTCPPDGVDMGQALNVGLAFMRNNPAVTHEPPGLLLIKSWGAAFPCSKAPK